MRNAAVVRPTARRTGKQQQRVLACFCVVKAFTLLKTYCYTQVSLGQKNSGQIEKCPFFLQMARCRRTWMTIKYEQK
jgi:hypothetical protein